MVKIAAIQLHINIMISGVYFHFNLLMNTFASAPYLALFHHMGNHISSARLQALVRHRLKSQLVAVEGRGLAGAEHQSPVNLRAILKPSAWKRWLFLREFTCFAFPTQNVRWSKHRNLPFSC